VTSESRELAATAFVKRRRDQPVAALFAFGRTRTDRAPGEISSCPTVRDAMNDAQRLAVHDGKGQISAEVSGLAPIYRAIGRNWL
jgi:hypothetical protein